MGGKLRYLLTVGYDIIRHKTSVFIDIAMRIQISNKYLLNDGMVVCHATYNIKCARFDVVWCFSANF